MMPAAMRLPGFALLLFAACSTTQTPEPEPFQPEPSTQPSVPISYCPEQRPEVCPLMYRPVCATRDNGVRCVTTPCDSSEQVTYPNGCAACADKRVFSYTPEHCEPTAADQQRTDAE